VRAKTGTAPSKCPAVFYGLGARIWKTFGPSDKRFDLPGTKACALPYGGGSGAGNEVPQLNRGDRKIQTPNISPSPHESAEPELELAEAERLLKSLASALVLRLLSRAATETRQATAEAKRGRKIKDAGRIRQANERLREAAMRLAEALRRVRAAERTSGPADIADAEHEPTIPT
jgi:hypothetical protein